VSAAQFTARHRGGAGEPLLLLHGFTDTWRTWELVLGALERRHEVLAPTLAGHAGGPPIDPDDPERGALDAIEQLLDAAGWEQAHIAGNSLGGYLALRLVEHARARGWNLAAERIDCPVRIVWGTEDRLLPWPSAAARYRRDWLPHADWVELAGVGHCPQLDVPAAAAELIAGFTAPSAAASGRSRRPA
jgi:pimeloyl-ACP methyl ester carboxylesterase